MQTEMNFEELIRRQAESVFGSKVKAHVWLARPRDEFGGLTGLEYARDEAGYNKAKNLLERIDQGYAC